MNDFILNTVGGGQVLISRRHLVIAHMSDSRVSEVLHEVQVSHVVQCDGVWADCRRWSITRWEERNFAPRKFTMNSCSYEHWNLTHTYYCLVDEFLTIKPNEEKLCTLNMFEAHKTPRTFFQIKQQTFWLCNSSVISRLKLNHVELYFRNK